MALHSESVHKKGFPNEHIPPKSFLSENGFSGSTLKLIAMAAMLIDHIGAVILQPMLTQGVYDAVFICYTGMRLIGRISFPLFAFLLTEGVQKTSNVKKYLMRLGIFALLSELPFDLAVSGSADPGCQNIFFTLFLGVLFVEICRKWQLQEQNPIRLYMVLGSFMLLAEGLQTDYGAVGILVIALLYLFRMDRMRAGGYAGIVLALTSLEGIGAFAALYPMKRYNGQRGLRLKYVFYAFYPVHLLILFWIASVL